jgi:hypothetical protein
MPKPPPKPPTGYEPTWREDLLFFGLGFVVVLLGAGATLLAFPGPQ